MPAKAARRAEGRKSAGRKRKGPDERETSVKSRAKPANKRQKRSKNETKTDNGPAKQTPRSNAKPKAPKQARNVTVKAAEKAALKQLKGVEKPSKAGSGKTVKSKTKVAAKPKLSDSKAAKIDKKQHLQSAVSVWETLRRHDTSAEEKAKLISIVLQQVEGREVQVATSPKGSRVLQACAKHGSPQQRKKLLQQLTPQLMDLSKSPYAHFLVCKLIATTAKEDIPAILALYRGHVATLLRHPSGASVIDELYNVASALQRNHLAAEFYGKEYTLLSQEAAPTLADLLKTVDSAKRRVVLRRMAVQLIPIMEKAIVDPVLTHRLIAEFIQAAAPAARQEAMENLAGEPLLRMVHTRDGAWAASALLSHGYAKDCKKFVKAMKGHVETMAKDRWGSLVLTAALSNVDDTVLMRKVILAPLQDKIQEMMEDKNMRIILLQLLSPNRQRYLSAELQALISPEVDHKEATQEEARSGGDGIEDGEKDKASRPAPGQRKKETGLRRGELLGSKADSLAVALLGKAREAAGELLRSPAASDVLVELATGGCDGILLAEHRADVEALQDVVAGVAQSDSAEGSVIADVYGSRALRRMVLASKDSEYDSGATERLAELLWAALKNVPPDGHAKKVAAAFSNCGYK